ncbi:MAG: helix-turn-helix domain-containing protein [Nitrospiraceae bacterium]
MKPHLNSCIEHSPTSQSVQLDGVWINLSAVSRETGLDIGYLSRVFSGKRSPNIFSAQKIAEAIGFSLGRFTDAVRSRKEGIESLRGRAS